MSPPCEPGHEAAKGARLSVFERYLTLWVFLCIIAGILLGQAFPAIFQMIGKLEVARVNIPVGILIWVMIIPMLIKIDFKALGQVKDHSRGIGVTLFINWLVKPFSMAFLAWLFVRNLFAPWLPPEQIDSYVAGLILDGVGIGKQDASDGVFVSHTPVLNSLLQEKLFTKLKAHGTAVGLPSDGDMGNSEVGHNVIGAGRIFAQGAAAQGGSVP